ncbi:hypothetical protein PIB30_118005 [Stylosanthes scabra]|uniref:Uncharacterized protein n=1 Tax=Stylosanthes scabra TaxID=79078 RepID=A0ABU6U5C0_9FABA|nr:hypothetical protein [Stylosanthes scabra]
MLTSFVVSSSPLPILPPVRTGGHHNKRNIVSSDNFPGGSRTNYSSRSLEPAYTQFPFGTRASSARTATFICAAALNARCGAEQTQTVTRQAPTMTHVPAKEKSPQLDDGGTGFPPGDDDDGGGGGGGGGGNWSGGFFFFGFLAFLGFLKDKESEGDSYNSRRRR